MVDLYIQILAILNKADLTNEQKSVMIKKMIDVEVVEKCEELIREYERKLRGVENEKRRA